MFCFCSRFFSLASYSFVSNALAHMRLGLCMPDTVLFSSSSSAVFFVLFLLWWLLHPIQRIWFRFLDVWCVLGARLFLPARDLIDTHYHPTDMDGWTDQIISWFVVAVFISTFFRCRFFFFLLTNLSRSLVSFRWYCMYDSSMHSAVGLFERCEF